MTKRAIFITHRTLPGRRQDVIEAWERHFRPLVEASGHDAYFYTTDDEDPDTIRVFQQYATIDAQDDLMSSQGYADYEAAVQPLLASPPEVDVATPVWALQP